MNHKTPIDERVNAVKSEIAEAQRASRFLGKMFMRTGRNRWIDVSLDEGWAYNAEERARATAMDVWRRTQKLPTIAELDRFVTFDADDHKYYANHGRDLMRDERTDIFEHRNKLTERSRRMMGDDA